MPYTVSIKPKAEKYLAGLRDARLYVRLREAIYRLAEDQHPPGSVKLQGEGELYRVRVGDYRIVYQVRDAVLVVLVVQIGAPPGNLPAVGVRGAREWSRCRCLSFTPGRSLCRVDGLARRVQSPHAMNTAAAKRAAAEALIKAAKGKAPKGVALVDFREPTAAERCKGRQLESLARECLTRNAKAAA